MDGLIAENISKTYTGTHGLSNQRGKGAGFQTNGYIPKCGK